MIRFENETNGRYYYLSVNKDLLNEFVLTIVRGGRHVCVVRHHGYACETLLTKEIERIKKRRIKRGYIMVQESN